MLILYEARHTFTSTVGEYLEAFGKHSRSEIWYAVGTQGAPLLFDLDAFDVVVIHYSVRLCHDWYLSKEYAKALKVYRGLKIVFIQDEYEDTDVARAAIKNLGIDVVFTCVPGDQVEKVYPRQQFADTEFVQVLTGYVPEAYEQKSAVRDPAERPILIGYRGRPLPYWYGALGQEKVEIGRRMHAICRERGLSVDIKWGMNDRIYGDAWYEFVRSCRVMLGTESGANVFDDRGEIRKNIHQALAFIPDLTFDEASKLFIGAEEGRVIMNQVSPKVFEAIAFHTGLVLFEGYYSGVLEPDKHYIPLKKDFSNVDDVLAKVQDADYVRAMTERAYRDVIETGRYSYREFIRLFDEVVERRKPAPSGAKFAPPQLAPHDPSWAFLPFRHILDQSTSRSLPDHIGTWRPSPVKGAIRRTAKQGWLLIPRAWRLKLWPSLIAIRNALSDPS